MPYWQHALLVMSLIGGSFFKSGGHNPIEPALAGKAIICGRSIFKNKSDYSLLINTGMIHQVKSNQTLRRDPL